MPLQLTSSDWITIVVGVVGIIAGYIFGLAQRDRRATALSWRLVSVIALTRPFREVKAGTIEVAFNGQQVEDVHLLVIRIQNARELPVVDYRVPVTITIKEKDGIQPIIHGAVISDMSSPSLEASIQQYTKQQGITLNNTRLNSGEWYDVQMIVSQPVADISPEQIEVRAEYIGVNVKAIKQFILDEDREATIEAMDFPVFNRIWAYAFMSTVMVFALSLVFTPLPLYIQWVILVQFILYNLATWIPGPMKQTFTRALLGRKYLHRSS